MGALNLTDEVAKAKREFRALKSQGLVVQPADATTAYSYDFTFSGILATSDENYAYLDGVTKNFTNVPPIDAWLYDVSVPSNDYGIDAGYVSLQKTNRLSFLITCPLISYYETGTYSFKVHISSIIPVTWTQSQ